MRATLDRLSPERGLNYSLIATPAEGLSGRFVRWTARATAPSRAITDRDYYTNGFHVPVYFDISAFDKIEIEAPYHALTNAGHISYIELDGDPSPTTWRPSRSVIRYMKESGIGYGTVNHPVDRDPVCGLQRHHRRPVPQVRPHRGRARRALRAHPPHHRLPGGHARPLQRRQARRRSTTA